ncbi:hypothetical protein SAY87_026802 [Trapa incisa]|uniref:Uncharacterized protein n=1 Tax=Trapa incisa TaxID=236973 RepID=A0AAN7GS28_9MYRT|nr:hypothetical protein SAY87_026802 [Trapa incisa]
MGSSEGGRRMHPIIWETVASSRNTAGGLCICTTGYCNKEILGCMVWLGDPPEITGHGHEKEILG